MNIDFSRPQVIKCPSCGATQAVPARGHTFKCDYCGERMLIPTEQRQGTPGAQSVAQPVIIPQSNDVAGQPPAQTGSAGMSTGQRQARVWLIVAISIAILLVGVLLFILLANIPASSSSGNNIPFLIKYPNLVQPTEVPSATFAMVLGFKKDQSGEFDDAHYIAKDAQQNIFAADYTSGGIEPEGELSYP